MRLVACLNVFSGPLPHRPDNGCHPVRKAPNAAIIGGSIRIMASLAAEPCHRRGARPSRQGSCFSGSLTMPSFARGMLA